MIESILGHIGKMIGASKSRYRLSHKKDLYVFNANVCIDSPDVEKIWFGDINITQEREQLKNAASELGKTLYVLYENDGRFENEERPLIHRFVYKVDEYGNETIGEREAEYYNSKTLLSK